VPNTSVFRDGDMKFEKVRGWARITGRSLDSFLRGVLREDTVAQRWRRRSVELDKCTCSPTGVHRRGTSSHSRDSRSSSRSIGKVSTGSTGSTVDHIHSIETLSNTLQAAAVIRKLRVSSTRHRCVNSYDE